MEKWIEIIIWTFVSALALVFMAALVIAVNLFFVFKTSILIASLVVVCFWVIGASDETQSSE